MDPTPTSISSCDPMTTAAADTPSLSILIPTHNRSELLARTLASLAQVERPTDLGVEAIVVANNCSDDTVAVATTGLAAIRAAWGPDQSGSRETAEKQEGDIEDDMGGRVVEEPEPGLNPARTRAVRESRGEWCVLLDDDVQLDRGWMHGIVAAFTQHRADVVGGRVTLWWDVVERPDWLPDTADSLLSANDRGPAVLELDSSMGVIGANFGFRRQVFDDIGGFKPGLDRVGKALMGGGETEFVQRALRHGCRVIYTPEAHVEHWVAPERLTRAYLLGVAHGGGVSRVLMKPTFPPPAVLRTVAGHTWLAVNHGLRRGIAKLRSDQKAELTHACRAAGGPGRPGGHLETAGEPMIPAHPPGSPLPDVAIQEEATKDDQGGGGRGGARGGEGVGVSVVILTMNEAVNLGACLDSCGWCDDVHVLDSGSTDGTVEIAEARGVPVHVHAFESFGKQRNWAIDHLATKYDWTFHLDADERFTPELVAELGGLFGSGEEVKADAGEGNERGERGERGGGGVGVDGYRCPHKMMLLGTWLRRSEGYPVYQVRLFHRRRMRFIDVGHGQRERPDAKLGTLREPYLHEAYRRGVFEWVARHNVHSQKEAEAIVGGDGPEVRWREVWSGDAVARRRRAQDVELSAAGSAVAAVVRHLVLAAGFFRRESGVALRGLDAAVRPDDGEQDQDAAGRWGGGGGAEGGAGEVTGRSGRRSGRKEDDRG